MISRHLKKYFLIILCAGIYLFQSDLKAQSLKSPLVFNTKLTYEIKSLGDSTDSQSIRTELAYLLIDDATSLFISHQTARLDSAMYLVHDEKEKSRIRSEINQHYAITSKILKRNNRISTYDLLFDDLSNPSGLGFYYDEPIPEWELSADTSSINGVRCQKATTKIGNRVWTAWFTAEIPIPDGPYKFSGLPGLVIQVQDERMHWVFHLRDIENDVNYVVSLEGLLDFEHVGSKEKFLAAKRDYGKSILEKEELRTGRKFTADTRAIVEKRLQSFVKRSSNWIELDSTN